MIETNNIPTISARFIPYQIFNGDYLPILDQLVRLEKITYTEREMLRILNGFAFKDGKCYPSQSTLESKINLGNSQTRNILRSLEKKGFIEIVRPAPLQRKLFKKHNEYFFLFHLEYYQFFELPQETDEQEPEQIQPENNTPDTQIDTQIDTDAPYNKSISPKIIKEPVPVSFHLQEKSILPELNQVAKQINAINTPGINHKRFNPVQAIGSALKQNIHPEAILEALRGTLKAWDIIQAPWGYFNKIISIKSGNYHERDHMRAANQIKADIQAMPELKKLIAAIG